MHRIDIELKNGDRHYVGSLDHLVYVNDLMKSLWTKGFTTSDVDIKPEDIKAIHVYSYQRPKT